MRNMRRQNRLLVQKRGLEKIDMGAARLLEMALEQNGRADADCVNVYVLFD
jgi:hypothetical protein